MDRALPFGMAMVTEFRETNDVSGVQSCVSSLPAEMIVNAPQRPVAAPP